jgi:hypothetical protein
MQRRQEQAQATPASALRMIDGGTGAVTGGGIVMGGSYDQKSNHHQCTEKTKPEKQPNRGTGDGG